MASDVIGRSVASPDPDSNKSVARLQTDKVFGVTTNMSTRLFDLTGKVALVSGASRGIGEQISRLLAQQGALFETAKIYEEWMSRIPLRRHAEPQEMVGTVLYLVSDAASYTNGECIVVDGGLSI